LYWGYSDVRKSNGDSIPAIAAEMISFDEKTYEATIKLNFQWKKESILAVQFIKSTSNREMKSDSKEYQITLKRPNY